MRTTISDVRYDMRGLCDMRNLKRKYLQFNNLVFDEYSVDVDYSSTFRTGVTPYTYINGALPSTVQGTQLVDPQQLALTLRLSAKNVPCNEYHLYRDYILTNILKPGRLWAVEGRKVLWAYAFVSDYGEVYDNDFEQFEISLNFTVYEGFWHIADKRKTFLYPYNSCHFNLSDEYRTAEGDCCCGECDIPRSSCGTCLTYCTDDMMETLCASNADTFNGLYKSCAPEYRLEYDCDRAHRTWTAEELRGYKICKDAVCDGTISGRFYSDTLLDTTGVTLVLFGKFINPYIELNGNAFTISGEYDGELTLKSSGEMFYATGECCDPVQLDPNLWSILYGSTFGLKVTHGWNTIYVETNDCCSAACVYYQVDAITI